MRPIDADALKAHIDKLPALPDGNFAGTHSALKALINMQPTIDAVPVVMCRECKHYREALSQTSDNAVVVWCAADKYPHNDVMPDDWYCAAGEREEEEQDNE